VHVPMAWWFPRGGCKWHIRTVILPDIIFKVLTILILNILDVKQLSRGGGAVARVRQADVCYVVACQCGDHGVSTE
jgi:hypothetical protein